MSKTEKKKRRDSAEYARYVFKNLYNNDVVRTFCAHILADAILVAHHISPSCWTLTLYSGKIRLNVGPVEVLVLSLENVFLVIADSEDNRFNHSKYHNFIGPSVVHYKSVPINQRLCNFSSETIESYYPMLCKNHHEFIQTAARRRNKTVWASSFSPGVILYLNSLLKLSLPMPAYFFDRVQHKDMHSVQSGAERQTILQEIEQFKNDNETLRETTKESIVKSRIGQGQFRTSLIDYWQGCSVTGCQRIELLRASHIKPWRNSSNEERLDLYNGLLLLPNLDVVFDKGMVSFKDNGEIIISDLLAEKDRMKLGIHSDMSLSMINKQHCKYLKYHRNNVFSKNAC